MLIYTVASRRWCCIHALSILHFAKLSDTSLDKLSQLYQLYPQEKNKTTQSALQRRCEDESSQTGAEEERGPNGRRSSDESMIASVLCSLLKGLRPAAAL